MFSLPSLPFRCVFDILFRYEAIDTLQAVLGQDCMCHHSRWSEVMTACCIVRRLENPAHALLLLCPPDRQIADSVNAWSVSYATTGFRPPMTLRAGVLIRAMKVFLGDEAFGWMDGASIKSKFLLLTEWEKLAKITLANYHFMNRWWKNWRLDSVSIQGTVDESIVSVGPAIAQLARDEKVRLLDALRTEENDKIMETKAQEQEKKRAKVSEAEKDKKPTKVTETNPSKPTEKKPRITPADTRTVEETALRRHEAHLRVLKDVEAVLRGLKADQFQRAASLIVRLGYEYPRIKWSLRLLLLHDVPVWQALRAMGWRAVDADPLGALVAMGK